MYIEHTFDKSYGDGEQICCLGVGGWDVNEYKGIVRRSFMEVVAIMNLYMCVKFSELHTEKRVNFALYLKQ